MRERESTRERERVRESERERERESARSQICARAYREREGGGDRERERERERIGLPCSPFGFHLDDREPDGRFHQRRAATGWCCTGSVARSPSVSDPAQDTNTLTHAHTSHTHSMHAFAHIYPFRESM